MSTATGQGMSTPADTGTRKVLGPITRKAGVAGQYMLTLTVTYTYSDGTTDAYPVAFVGTEYGHGVVLCTDTWTMRVVDPERFGDTLDSAWIERFYSDPLPTGTLERMR